MAPKSYIPDYPRPQLVRPDWQNLNGAWDFCFDDADGGESARWYEDFPGGKKINLPFTYETKLSGIGDEGHHPVVWYSKTLELNAAQCAKRCVLHFEGSDYLTKVWVNGRLAGEHTGGYARFSFDISRLLKTGENVITVRVWDSLDEAQARGKQRWVKDNFGCWYVQTTGIWKTVWLEFLPQSYIGRVKMTPDLTAQTLLIEAEIEAACCEGMTFTAEATFGDKPAGNVTVQVERNRARAVLSVRNVEINPWGVAKWTPNNPALYDITFTLADKSGVGDTALSYFGMREVKISGQQVLLNNEPLYQRLILDQGYWEDSHLTPPSEEALIEDIDKIFALGYNGLRKHQKTEDERFLYWCDVKGMLVWSEMAANYEYSDNGTEAFMREWMEIVRQNYNHPCIITWTPVNESWGVPSIKTDRAQQHFTEAVYYLTKSFDQMRPVIVNDGWEHTISDIITLHDYQESGEAFFEKYNDRADDLLANKIPHSRHRYAFADGYEYKGQPVIISEYGGIAFKGGTGWGYGNLVEDEDVFIKRFESITTAIQRLPYVCGYCYTQVTDVQQEVNGLMDIKRQFKIDPEIIKKINLQSPKY